jgi:hypothetical protein
MKTIHDLIIRIEHLHGFSLFHSPKLPIKDTRYEGVTESDTRLRQILVKSKFTNPETSNRILKRLILNTNNKKHSDHKGKTRKCSQLIKGIHFRIPGSVHEIYKKDFKHKAKTAVVSSSTSMNKEISIMKFELKDKKNPIKSYSLRNLTDVNNKNVLYEEHKKEHYSIVEESSVKQKSISASDGKRFYRVKGESHIEIKPDENARRYSTFLS